MPKQEERIIIRAMPWRSGLTNQGGQATVPENLLWDATNVDMDSSGRLFKRPGLRKWGTSLLTQPATGYHYSEAFYSLDNFIWTSSGIVPGNTLCYLDGNELVFRTKTATSGTFGKEVLRKVQTPDGTVTSSNTCTAVFQVKADTAMPAQDSTTNDDHGFSIRVRTDHANVLTLLWLADGWYYYNGTNYVSLDSTSSYHDIDDGRWHIMKVAITDASTGAATITFDEDTTNAAFSITYTTTGTSVLGGTMDANQVVIRGYTNDQGVYQARVGMVQYTDATALNAANIQLVQAWSSGNPEADHLLVVCNDLIYDDTHLNKTWKALDSAPSGEIITCPWISELLIFGDNDVGRRWDGKNKPILMPESAPNHIIAATAHQGRLFCVKREEPLNVYYSDANDLDTWTDTNKRNNQQDSYFPIPDAKGGRITAMRGDFYGLLIIWTESSTWIFETAGQPLLDGRLRLASANVGCVGPRAHDAIGRDILFLSKDGLYSMSTVQEYGDVTSASVTTVLRGLFTHNNNIDTRKIVTSRKSCVVHAPNEAKTYVSVQRTGERGLNSIYVFNHDTKQWIGPWTFDSTLTGVNGGSVACMTYAKLGGRQYLMAASSLGDVAYFANDRKSDYPATIDGDGYPIQFYLRSSRLDGRSVNPTLTRKYKRWRGIWFYVLPRGGDSLKLTYNVDGNSTSETVTVSLNPYDEPLLDTTFNLGESALGDPERIGIVWLPLDVRGRWLEFIVEINNDTAADSKDIALVGFEIDATAGDEDKE